VSAALGLLALFAASCAGVPARTGQSGGAARAPLWVNDLEAGYPAADWAAGTGSGANREAAENAARMALARMFKTDVKSLTATNQRLSEIVKEAAGKKTVIFDESSEISQTVNTTSNVQGLIGVEMDTYQGADEWYACARMNRKESAARYSNVIKEGAAAVSSLAARGRAAGATMEGYAAFAFAVPLAEVTDNYQNILEVLDPAASNRRPAYGGAAAIRDSMRACAAKITIAVTVKLSGGGATSREETTIRRALAAFFTDRGFKAREGGTGDYALDANVTLEAQAGTKLLSCRYYFDTALKDRNGKAVFSSTEDKRASDLDAAGARRLALRDLESSITNKENKEGTFAQDFAAWLGELLE
jgi:hypothetical protein